MKHTLRSPQRTWVITFTAAFFFCLPVMVGEAAERKSPSPEDITEGDPLIYTIGLLTGYFP